MWEVYESVLFQVQQMIPKEKVDSSSRWTNIHGLDHCSETPVMFTQTLGVGTLERGVVEHGIQQLDTHPPLLGQTMQIS